MRKRVWLLFLLASTGSLWAAEDFRLPGLRELELAFKPPHAEQMALSPDGRHLAYTAREARWLTLVVVNLEEPKKGFRLPLGEERRAGFGVHRRNVPVMVSFLRWASAERLVYARVLPMEDGGRGTMRDEVCALGVDGRDPLVLVGPKELEEVIWPLGDSDAPPIVIPRRGRVIGFNPEEPGFVYVEAVGGREVQTELFKVDVMTGADVSVFFDREHGRIGYDQQCRPRLRQSAAVKVDAPVDLRPSQAFRKAMQSPPAIPYRTAPNVRLVPQYFSYRPADGSRWHGWSEWIGDPALRFEHTPENLYGTRALPLAFAADPNVLYFASNAGRDTYGLYALDLRTKQRTAFAIEDGTFDLADPRETFASSALVFDRARRLVGVRLPGPRGGARWFDAEVARWQAELEADFPGRLVDIIEWDDERRRVLVVVSSASDAGRVYVVTPGRADGLKELVRRTPWWRAEELHATTTFAFESETAGRITGTLTLPRRVRLNPPPLVVYCRDLPGRRGRPGLNREVHALASMGFAVVQVDYRGLLGWGARHRDAVKAGFDRVPIAEIRATVAWLAGQKKINPRRVALLGHGFGGYVAARAVQLWPAEFRCAVAINAPTDLGRWLREEWSVDGRVMPSTDVAARRWFFSGGERPLEEISLVGTADLFRRPLFLLQDVQRRDLDDAQGRRLRDALRRRDLDAEYVTVSNDFSLGDPSTRARAFLQIHAFLNEHVFDYAVEVGEAVELGEAEVAP